MVLINVIVEKRDFTFVLMTRPSYSDKQQAWQSLGPFRDVGRSNALLQDTQLCFFSLPAVQI
jgi:hypothetical protein